MESIAHRFWGVPADFTGVLKSAAVRLGLVGALFGATAVPLGAVSAATAPAGFVRASVAGAAGSSRTSTSLIATPLLIAPVYVGRVSQAHAASGGAEIASQSLNAAQPARFDTSKPHAVFVTSGVFAGFTFRVLGSNARGITVDALGFDLAQILAPGDTFEVRPLRTFRSLFGGDAASVPFMAHADPARADQLLVQRDGSWRAYWFTGSTWRRTGSIADAGDDVLMPQDGIVVHRRATTAVDLRFVGDAPATDAVLALPAGAVSTIANPFPTETTIGEFGFETVSGWRCAARTDEADQVQVCRGNAWLTFWHNGTAWMNTAGTAADATIPAGSALVVVRKAGTAANPFALITRPYDL